MLHYWFTMFEAALLFCIPAFLAWIMACQEDRWWPQIFALLLAHPPAVLLVACAQATVYYCSSPHSLFLPGAIDAMLLSFSSVISLWLYSTVVPRLLKKVHRS